MFYCRFRFCIHSRKRLIQKSENHGISALIINTGKGKNWIDKVENAWYMEESPLELVSVNNSMLVQAGKENAHRTQFFSKLDTMPIEANLRQCVVRGNVMKLRLIRGLTAMGLYKPLRNAVHMLHRH